MKKWYIYVFSLIISSAIYFTAQNQIGIIAATATFILSIASVALLDILRDKYSLSTAISVILAVFMSMASVGLASPLLSKFPIFVALALFSLLVCISAYLFSEYNNKVRFAEADDESEEAVAEETKEFKKIPKILDTSIVIDGRIIDIASTGFVDSPFIIPNFVLRELQLISDSPDPIKRNRGRRGLDLLNTLRKREDLEVEISYKDYTDTREVDAKLIKLSKDLKGKLITNDFNLNKVAELQGIEVLNINNLANALKPVVLPGEEFDLQVIKEGKDDNQGIGYLDDGTMVVIENGGRLVGKKVKVNVTSIIQTNAGKMIFTRVADGKNHKN